MKFNNRKYGSRAIFWAQLHIALIALVLAVFFFSEDRPLLGVACISAIAFSLARPQARLCAVTLSVPEILMDVMDAFKLETPELFGENGFGTEFSSKTAVLGDKVTAKIAHVPVAGVYDRANGGFKNATQDVTTVIEDVPVTISSFPIITINVSWITQLASKIPLYKEAIRNLGFGLGKAVLDTVLTYITPGNFSNQIPIAIPNINLDTVDGAIRDQLNLQKAAGRGRFLIVNTPFASKLGADDRVRSSLFYGAKNPANGYRMWQNLGGMGWVREYPDLFAGGNLIAFGGDRRAIAVATRQLDFANVTAEQLGVPKVMEFYNIVDPETNIPMTAAGWQEAGTGDVYIGAGILFGVGAGKQGGNNGTITDNAGIRIISA